MPKTREEILEEFCREFLRLHIEYVPETHENDEENLVHKVRDFFRDEDRVKRFIK